MPLFEDWLDSVNFSDRKLGNKVKLAGEELLDNLIRHSSPLAGGRLKIELTLAGRTARITFHFRSEAFRAFAQNSSIPKAEYDVRDGRWRGLGLFMIASLTRKASYRSGFLGDRIEAVIGEPFTVSPRRISLPQRGALRTCPRTP